jgi:hypothetical protein
MIRLCRHCSRAFTAQDFVKEESKNMEADRKRLGLEGIRFLYYTCPACKYDDIFLDMHHRDDETSEQFELRRDALEKAIRVTHTEKVQVTLTER